MNSSFLQRNTSKTDAYASRSSHQIQSSSISTITFSGQNILLSSTVTNLSVRFNSQLAFEMQITHLYKTSSYHLKKVSELRPLSLHPMQKNYSILSSRHE
ncbi:hypothetical protein ILYODFUR_024245 [Ilyodon furcidens]|uniref:Uncharacterized protein n=1 Tax=Ilyodon furcidens TaxID=33524 RepID=A0ABV0T0V0_9TELE